MRLAIFGLISLVALHTVCRAQVQDLLVQDQLVQEIQQLVADSSWTVPFSNYITSNELPPGQSLEVATVSERLCGAGFVNSSGQVNVALLQDISEFTFVNISTYYYVDVLKATEAQAASMFCICETGLLISVFQSSSQINTYVMAMCRCHLCKQCSRQHPQSHCI